MNTLQATFKIVTPMFISGADQKKAELRGPSIKSALRFWYRAIDPDFAANEPRIFGGSGEGQGQAIFLLKIKNSVSCKKWEDPFQCFSEINPDFESRNKPLHASTDTRTWQTNGIRYLGYPLFMKDHQAREYIPAGNEFQFELRFKQCPIKADQRRVLAALWLFGHFGGLGTRSRRGFGVVAMKSISIKEGNCWEEIKNLPLAIAASNTNEWEKAYCDALANLKKWFPSDRSPEYSTFSEKTKICLLEPQKFSGCQNREDWEYALDTAGKVMQRFRQRLDLNDPSSDYFRVKQYLCRKYPEAAKIVRGVSPAPLIAAPERAAFGLPLTFRYSSLTYEYHKNGKVTPEITFEGELKTRSRSASRIWVRVVEIGTSAYPVFFRLDGPLLNPKDKIKYLGGTLNQPADTILDQFWRNIPKKIIELQWSNL